MTTFYTIIHTIKFNKNDNDYCVLYEKKKDIQYKMAFLYKTLINMFITPVIKDKILQLFQESQKTYYAFCKFANIFRFKKSKIAIDADLYLNPIVINDKRAIQIYQSESKFIYIFTINDLLNIIYTSIMRNYEFFPDPMMCKNPYTNIPFSLHHLYNIYFHILDHRKNVPYYLQRFFLCGFDIDLFKLYNEQYIRDEAIHFYIYKSSPSLLKREIDNMMNYIKIPFQINKLFPYDILISVMRPYLYLYCIYNYSVYGTDIRGLAQSLLNHKMMEFFRINPKFGRRFIHSKFITLTQKKKVIHYSTKHPVFTIEQIKKAKYEYVRVININLVPCLEPFYEEDFHPVLPEAINISNIIQQETRAIYESESESDSGSDTETEPELGSNHFEMMDENDNHSDSENESGSESGSN